MPVVPSGQGYVELINSTTLNTMTVNRYNAWERDVYEADGVFKKTNDSPYNGLLVTETPVPSLAVQINLDSSGYGTAYVRETSAIQKSTDITKQLWKIIINTVQTVPITSNISGSPRFDRIICRVDKTIPGDRGASALFFESVPGLPALAPEPDDSITLATVEVASGSSTIFNTEITDLRQFPQIPARHVENLDSFAKQFFYSGIIPDEDQSKIGNELKVIAQAVPTMSIDVLNGSGSAFMFFGTDKISNPVTIEKNLITVVPISASNPTFGRYTIVYINISGVITTFDCTASASPDFDVATTFWNDKFPLAFIFVGATVTTITTPVILDARYYLPVKSGKSGNNDCPNSTFGVHGATLNVNMTTAQQLFLWNRTTSAGLTFAEQISTSSVDETAYRLQATDATGSGLSAQRDILLPTYYANKQISFQAKIKRGANAWASLSGFVGIQYTLSGLIYQLNLLDNAQSPRRLGLASTTTVANTQYQTYQKSCHIPIGATNIKFAYNVLSTASFSIQDFQLFIDQIVVEEGSSFSEWSPGGNDEFQLWFLDPNFYTTGGAPITITVTGINILGYNFNEKGIRYIFRIGSNSMLGATRPASVASNINLSFNPQVNLAGASALALSASGIVSQFSTNLQIDGEQITANIGSMNLTRTDTALLYSGGSGVSNLSKEQLQDVLFTMNFSSGVGVALNDGKVSGFYIFGKMKRG